MKQFITIVLRNQFTLFYRFGYTYICNNSLVEFDGSIDNEVKENIIKQFSRITPFEYDQEYLILHLEKDTVGESDFTQFEIQDIVAIYPLSKQAKESIESKIDQRIQLEEPIFESILPAIEKIIEKKEVEKAISALWTICKFKEPVDRYLSKIGLENLLKGLKYRKDGVKAYKIKGGNYWDYLIAYDRYDYFPNSILGYFYDAGQILAFSKGLPSFEGSETHRFLEKLNSSNPEVKLPEIIIYFETEEQLKNYVNHTTVGELKLYIIAPLFLILRDEIRKSDDISQTKLLKNLEYLKTFGDSFNYAVILLGVFFGFRKFYDNYYDALNLRFYKNYKTKLKEIETEVQQEKDRIDLEKSIGEKNEEKNQTEKQAVENQVEETKQIQETLNVKTGMQNKKEKKPGISSQIQKIIQDALSKQPEIKMADIAKMIKEQTCQSTQVGIIENVAKQMNEIEIIKIGKAKGIRKKGTYGKLFDQ
ncbi:MAG TPA: hypothetical protein PKY76_01810 [Bacteroidales bacterium]|nr:hypothetical protein [Bacteroidales bacterium]